MYKVWLKRNGTFEFRSLFRCISYNVYIVEHVQVLSHLYLSPSKYSPLALMHFFILFDHALKYCENSSFVMALRYLVRLVLISLTPWKIVFLRIPFSFWKRKKSQELSPANKVDDATWWFLLRPKTVSCWGLRGQEHCRDARSKFFLPRKLFAFDEFCWKDESELPCESVG